MNRLNITVHRPTVYVTVKRSKTMTEEKESFPQFVNTFSRWQKMITPADIIRAMEPELHGDKYDSLATMETIVKLITRLYPREEYRKGDKA